MQQTRLFVKRVKMYRLSAIPPHTFLVEQVQSCTIMLCIPHFLLEGSSVFHGVWLLDLSLQWHRLSDSFSDYLRQAVVHLGLRQWPYALTTNRISPQFEVRGR